MSSVVLVPPSSTERAGHKCALVVFSCLLVLLLAVPSCNEPTLILRPELGLNGRVTLENQSDHSGVLVTILGLDTTAVTDSGGYFSFSDIPDGEWSLEAVYPYFESDTTVAEMTGGVLQSPVDMELRQLLQFSIEPSDTTISMSESAWDDYHFKMEFWGHLENLSGHSVRVVGTRIPFRLLAIRPVGFTASDFCDERYGWLSPVNTYDFFDLTFAPSEKRLFGLGLGYRFWTTCFEPGTYEVYWSLLDNGHYKEHFEPYSELNRTLLAKRELLSPITLTLVE
jgi:hypothetical protein